MHILCTSSFCYGDKENRHRACTNGYLTTANQSEIRKAYLVSVFTTREMVIDEFIVPGKMHRKEQEEFIMKKKKVFLFLTTLVSAAMLCACSDSEEPAASTPEATTEVTAATDAESSDSVTTLKDGVLTVGIQVDYPPFEQYSEDGVTPIGYDCDIIEAIAADMGLEVEYVDTAWEGIFAGLDTDKYDLIISGVTITDERLEKYDFSDPYIQNYQCMVIRTDSGVEATSPEELDGLKVAFQAETTSDIYMTELMENGLACEPFEYEKILECFSELDAGRIDAIVCDSTVTYPYLSKADNPYEMVWKQDEAPEEFGICLKKDSPLTDPINAGLKKLSESGKIDEFMNKWFSE